MPEQPSWYKDTEKWLLKNGTGVISVGLIVLIMVSLFFLVSVNSEKKYAIPAAAWVTYMFMP